MVTISLEQFVRTGILGPVRLGMTREQLRQILGDPAATGGTSRKYRVPSILKYGDLEFLFEPNGHSLRTIYMDGFTVPRGGRSLDLDPWIVVGGMAIGTMEYALAAADIGFTRHTLQYDPNMPVLSTTSGVDLGVINEPEDLSPPVGLHHVSKRLENMNRGG
jgi:hypothetical protein